LKDATVTFRLEQQSYSCEASPARRRIERASKIIPATARLQNQFADHINPGQRLLPGIRSH